MPAKYRSAAIGCALLAGVTCTAGADILEFVLDNHPRGDLVPPRYGMRLDGLFGDPAEEVTFSFSGNGAGVSLVVDTDARTITITGQVFGGVDNGTDYLDPQLYDLSMTYTMIEDNNGGWDVGEPNGTGSGTLTRGLDQWDLTTRLNNVNHIFEFYPDRHRLLEGDLPGVEWVGRGWLDIDGDPMGSGETRDFLFTATLVSAPAPVWIGLAGLLGVGVATHMRQSCFR